MNRVFYKGSIASLSFWHGGAGLSFVAFNLDLCRAFNDVCDGEFGVAAGGAASDALSNGKTRYGPFVGFRKVLESFKSVSMGTVLFDTVKIYERMCLSYE